MWGDIILAIRECIACYACSHYTKYILFTCVVFASFNKINAKWHNSQCNSLLYTFTKYVFNMKNDMTSLNISFV